MNRTTVAVATAATAAAAAGGAAAWYRMRTRTASTVVHHFATVLTDLDETLAAWREPVRVPGLLAEATPATDNTRTAFVPLPGGSLIALRVLLAPAPERRGTEIRVRAEGPGARAHSGRLRADLRHLKAVLECGEAVTVEGQPSARGPADEQVQDRLYAALRGGGRG